MMWNMIAALEENVNNVVLDVYNDGINVMGSSTSFVSLERCLCSLPIVAEMYVYS